MYINKQKQLFFPLCYCMGNWELMLRKYRFGCKSFFGNSFAPKMNYKFEEFSRDGNTEANSRFRSQH
jgi:hypothetical protein